MPDVLILIVCVVLLTLALGLPLLLKPDSVLPEILAFGILAVAVLAFLWATDAYWIILPILALLASVAWLERDGQNWPNAGRDALGGGAVRTNGPSQLRLRLWRTANRIQIALLVCGVILPAAGVMRSTELIVPWIVVVLVAMVAFRFSFVRASRRDQLASSGEATEYPR